MSLKRFALKFIVMLGIVSLFADITYEGARSITGPFLSTLQASGTAVGIVIGFGEFIGYALRALSGIITDKTKRYWLITFLGYSINLVAVPLLAFANNWQMASVFIILERFGKAIRNPARDAMLSYATKHTGRGFGFGLHEALDQIGAITGPVVIAILLGFKESYRIGFAALSIPAVFALVTLQLAKKTYPNPHDLEVKTLPLHPQVVNRQYALYLLATGLVAAGYADFALIAYHFQKAQVVPSFWIPLFYAIAMGSGGLSALIIGKLFDKKGVTILALVTALSALFAPLVFFGGFIACLMGMLLFGIGLGAHESIMRAFVATLVPKDKRASSYGILNFVFGLSWAIGSAIIGLFYDISLTYVVAFSLLTQFASVPLFLLLKKPSR